MFLFRRLRSSCTTLIVGLVFIVLGSAMTVIFGQTITLDCTRQEPAYVICERRSSFMGFALARPQTISGVQGAWMEENCDDDCTYRVVLQADRGNVPLTSSFSSGSSAKDEAIRQINAYLDGSETETTITSPPNRVAMLAAASFAVIGLLLPFFGLFRR